MNTWITIILICIALVFSAFGSAPAATGNPGQAVTQDVTDTNPDQLSEKTQDSDQNDFTWQIQLRDYQIADHLHTDEGVQQYEGDVLDVPHDDAPEAGNVYLILTMTISKSRTGGGTFSWKKFTVVDEAGNVYQRMSNDSFISMHTFKRLPGTSLQIGENKGSICLEIPQGASEGSLKICYDAGDEGINTITIK
jgi:hypothetical protein